MAAEAKYDLTAYPVQVAVRSASDGAAVHMVTLPYCDCADFTNRRGRVIETPQGFAITLCKHIIAAMDRVGGWHREPQPEVIPDLDQRAVRELLTGPRVKMTGTGVRDLISALSMLRTQEREFVGQAGKGYATYDARLSRFTVTLLH